MKVFGRMTIPALVSSIAMLVALQPAASAEAATSAPDSLAQLATWNQAAVRAEGSEAATAHTTMTREAGFTYTCQNYPTLPWCR